MHKRFPFRVKSFDFGRKLLKSGSYKIKHGFKQDRSTITTALNTQSIISRAIDEKNFYVLASLDLSAAFDLVNRNLLFKRMEHMGIPNDILMLLKDWLNDRLFYIDDNCQALQLY